VCRGIETEAVTQRHIAPWLSPADAQAVRCKARDLVARYVAAEFLEVT
jgi:hypothetical protein